LFDCGELSLPYPCVKYLIVASSARLVALPRSRHPPCRTAACHRRQTAGACGRHCRCYYPSWHSCVPSWCQSSSAAASCTTRGCGGCERRERRVRPTHSQRRLTRQKLPCKAPPLWASECVLIAHVTRACSEACPLGRIPTPHLKGARTQSSKLGQRATLL